MRLDLRALSAAAILFTAASSSAIAQDGRGPWSGMYLGVNGGWGKGSIDWSYYNNNTGQRVNRSPDAALLGVHAGIQWQFQQFILGVETSYSNSVGGDFSDFGPDIPSFATRFNTSAKFDGLFTLGPRIGLALSDRWMIFGTGGYANTHIDGGFIFKANPAVNSDVRDVRHNGWFAGGGVEYAMTKEWLLGLEYQHFEFETKVVGPPGALVTDVTRYVSGDADVVRARLTYKVSFERDAALK